MIQFLDPKFGSDYQWQEQFSTYFNLMLAFVFFSYPFFILRIYEVHLERVDPFPNPLKGMTQ